MDLVWQSISIIGPCIVFFMFLEIVYTMEYSFYNIFVNFWKWVYCRVVQKRYRDDYIEPLSWLSSNTGYLGALMLVVGNFFTLVALLAQIRTGEYHTKMPIFFVSTPLNQFGLALYCINPIINFIKSKLNLQNHHDESD